MKTELERELERLGIENEPQPESCPQCKKELKVASGYVGEMILYCEIHGVQWEDSEDAIRRVL